MKRSYIVLLLFLFAVLTAGAMDFIAPLDEYRITSRFGYRTDPMGGNSESQLHKGIDLVGPHHAPVKAAADGVVVEHWPAPNGYYKGHPVYGGLVVIDHLDGTHTLYAHLSRTYVAEGDRVLAGRVIGRQGNSGKSTGEHLHFEIVIDPLTVMHPNFDQRLDKIQN
jgi:murein DD-endopeptidase MepM/ murein hydrolase activator NlpD